MDPGWVAAKAAKTRVPGFAGTGGGISSWLSDPQNLKSMRRLGTLGEGGFLMQNNLHGLGVERTVRYDVHQLNIPGWQSITGQPIEEALGMKKGQQTIIGYKNGNPIFANGQQNFIENVFEMGQGVLGVEVRTVETWCVPGRSTHFFARARGARPSVPGLPDRSPAGRPLRSPAGPASWLRSAMARGARVVLHAPDAPPGVRTLPVPVYL